MQHYYFCLVAVALALTMVPGVEPSAAATTESAVVVSDDLALADDFGWDVALQGRTLVVGAEGVPSGVYLATVRAGEAMRTTQVVLVK